jgi:hypothetical protein
MIARAILLVVSFIVSTIALFLPYRARLIWFEVVSYFAHLPSRAFAFFASYIIKRLDLNE